MNAIICGSGLARDCITAVWRKLRSACIASKPAPTLVCVLLLGFTPLAHAFDLQQLSDQLAKPQVIHGDFIQEKHLRALPKPYPRPDLQIDPQSRAGALASSACICASAGGSGRASSARLRSHTP